MLFTLPDASTTLAALGAWSSPIFNNFLPAIELIAGIALGIFFVAFIIGAFTNLFKK